MLIYPTIHPIALSFGPLKIHWYGLMYGFGFLSAWLGIRWQTKNNPTLSKQVDDLIFYAAMGVIIGGRVGYMLFYQFSELLAHPLILFKIWQGGMSFHGGLIGVCCAVLLLAYRQKIAFLTFSDLLAPWVPIGLGLGRLGNFINGELWGRPTDLPWGMVFPQIDLLPRHPSQLYEALGEGLFLGFIDAMVYSKTPRNRKNNRFIFIKLCLNSFCFRVFPAT